MEQNSRSVHAAAYRELLNHLAHISLATSDRVVATLEIEVDNQLAEWL